MSGLPSNFLVGAQEIAEYLGLEHPRSVHTIREHHVVFPNLIAILKKAFIWDWRDFENRALQTGRLHG